MRKKSKYKPKHQFTNPVAWVLEGLKPFSTSDASLNLRIKNHDAMDKLRRGDATIKDIDVLIGAFNMCEAYMRLRPELGEDWKEEIKAGLDALHAVGVRGAQAGRFILKAQELIAMNLVMEIHDAQLDNTTINDMERAMNIVTQEYRARRMRPIIQKEKK